MKIMANFIESVPFLLFAVALLFSRSEGLGSDTFVDVDLCREVPSPNGTVYCHCKENVINCDFSSVKTNEKIGVAINGWKESNNVNIKRLCFCGGPRNLHLFIGQNIFIGLPMLHRVDFYNIPGVVHLRYAMSVYFSGDVYMSNVRISTIHTTEFGPADSFPIEDVSGIECCSKITAPKNLSHPILHMDNTKIGLIEKYGIDDSHRWSNVILHKVAANVDQFGIALTSSGTNVSMSKCIFNDTKEEAIVLRDFANVFMASNSFSNYSHPVSLRAESMYPESNLLLFENYFHAASYLSLDAKKVLVWFNHLVKWDSEDFYRANKTLNPGRLYAVQFNTFRNGWKEGKLTDADAPYKSLIFQENILGQCSCSHDYSNVSKIFLDSRCELQNKADRKQVCNPEIRTIKEKCKGYKMELDYESMCHGEISYGSSYRDYKATLDHFLRMHNTSLNSPFIDNVLKEHMGRYNYEVVPISMDEPESTAERQMRDEGLPSSASKLMSLFSTYLVMLLMV